MAKLKDIFKIATLGLLSIVLTMIFLAAVAHGTTYVISNCVDLQNVANDLNGDYFLNNSIDCSDTINWNTGEGFAPINEFAGTFDGRGYLISNLYINRPSASSIGMFGSMSSVAVIIKNVGIVDANISCNYYCGVFGGYMTGLLNNSFSTGSAYDPATNAYLGGLVGVNTGTIIDSYSLMSVSTPNAKIGGVAGLNAGLIANVFQSGVITGAYTGGQEVGGLCGMEIGGLMSGTSYFNGEISNLANFRSKCASGSMNTYEFENTTAQLKMQENYVGWDFNTTWQSCFREDPKPFPTLQVFGLCCVPDFKCTKYTACGQYHQECLSVADKNCGYIYTPEYDGNITEYGRNCTINAQSEDVGLQGFDLRYESNVLLLLVMIVAYIGVMAIAFAFHNPAFGFLGFLIGVGIGLIFMQVSPYLTIGFILLNILVFYNTSRGR